MIEDYTFIFKIVIENLQSVKQSDLLPVKTFSEIEEMGIKEIIVVIIPIVTSAMEEMLQMRSTHSHSQGCGIWRENEANRRWFLRREFSLWREFSEFPAEFLLPWPAQDCLRHLFPVLLLRQRLSEILMLPLNLRTVMRGVMGDV